MRSVLLIAATAALAGCSVPAPVGTALPSGTPLQSGTALSGGSIATAAPATGTAVAPTTPPNTSPGPSATPAATPTPAQPTTGNTPDSVLALATVQAYMDNLVAGRYTRAWQLLSAQSQQQSGSLAAFTAERSAFFASAGKRFSLLKPHNSEAELTQWLPQDFDGQRSQAYVVTVGYPRLAGDNAGTAVLVAAPDADGDWRIWVAR